MDKVTKDDKTTAPEIFSSDRHFNIGLTKKSIPKNIFDGIFKVKSKIFKNFIYAYRI